MPAGVFRCTLEFLPMPLLHPSRPLWSVSSATALLLTAGMLSGCGSYGAKVTDMLGNGLTKVIKPYKVDIVQGNVVTREQLAQIKPGVSRNDVRDLIGSPLVSDAFHADRWDYVFTLRRDGQDVQSRKMVVWFDGEVVKSVEAAELPSEREFVASIATEVRGNPRKLTLTDAERQALPPPRPALAASAAAPLGANRTYPSLEPL